MKIQIDGTNTLNKGAELMLKAIYDQVVKRFPEAKIYYNPNEIEDSLPDFFIEKEVKKRAIVQNGRIPSAILRRLKLPYTYFTPKYAIKGLDLVLDGAGFQFSDQWRYTEEMLNMLENYYGKLKRQGTKIVLLPQAFGPFETPEGKRTVSIINEYVDLIIAREQVSYRYVIDAGADKNKVWLYPDFTLLVKGVFPQKHESVRDKICVIPNKKMITHTSSGSEDYISFITKIVSHLEKKGEQVFLLNHEGEGDLALCQKINKILNQRLTIITGLGPEKVKGVIGASKMVISSRFHGVASALNQGVPCLATSWNHKYQMLFKDFGQENMVLVLGGILSEEIDKIDNALAERNTIKSTLKMRKKVLTEQVQTMWNRVWSETDL